MHSVLRTLPNVLHSHTRETRQSFIGVQERNEINTDLKMFLSPDLWTNKSRNGTQRWNVFPNVVNQNRFERAINTG